MTTTPQSIDFELQAELLYQKVRHYLITTMGRISEEANDDEIYRALSYTLREEIMINWLASARTFQTKDVRMVYYLSLEYYPGRILSNNITNICAIDIVKAVLQKLNRGYLEILRRESDPGLGNGGLGRLASCFLDSIATHHYPGQGYGLRYQYGTFEQQIWDGMQIEAPDMWLINENPWEFRRDLRRASVKYCGNTVHSKNIHGDDILLLQNYEEVWALPYDIPIVGYSSNHHFSVATLRLWSTKESPRNFQLQKYNAGRLDQAAENTTLTDVLYPSDQHEVGKRARLKQEFLLVSASLQDIIRHYLANHENFRLFSDKVRIQINDTHPALVVAELIRVLTMKYDIPWKMAVEITEACTGYTNHTILSEALEQWDQSLFSYLLPRQYNIIERLNLEFCNTLRNKYPNDEAKVQRLSIIEKGMVRMANLAIVGSHKVNGVARIHTEILKKSVFKDFYELYPEKFVNVTNGVTQRRWLLLCNPELARFITARIGDKWITDFLEIKKIAAFAKDPESIEEFIAIKKRNKLKLIEYINKENHIRNGEGHIIGSFPIVDPDSLFDVQIKRIHEYKRQLMNALHIIMLYFEMLEKPGTRIKRTVIFGGKAAAGYETAKDIIRLICCIARKVNRDPDLNGNLRVIYIENYNVTRAETIIPAAELSEQISTAGTEASGTGNMKLTINGALTIGTNDGSTIEMREEIGDQWWPFAFGASAEEIERLKQAGTYKPMDVCNQYPAIKRAIDSLTDGTFAVHGVEHDALYRLYQKLIEGYYGSPADRYFTLYDLDSFYQTQRKVEALYQTPELWAECAINNIAGMGTFSADYSIQQYSKLIWGISPCPADEEILERIRHEYSEHDKCRIY